MNGFYREDDEEGHPDDKSYDSEFNNDFNSAFRYGEEHLMGKIVEINKETVDKDVYDTLLDDYLRISDVAIHKQAEVTALASIIVGFIKQSGESRIILPISLLQIDGGGSALALVKNEDNTITVSLKEGESTTVQ